MTPALVRCGVRATWLTLVGGVLAAMLPAIAAMPHAGAYWHVALAGMEFQLFDCLDGNVARVRDDVSCRGDYLDMLFGQFYWVTLLTAFGLLVQQQTRSGRAQHGLVLGLTLGVVVVLSRLCRDYAAHMRPPIVHGPVASGVRAFLSGLDCTFVFLILVGGATRTLAPYFLVACVWVAGATVVVQMELWYTLKPTTESRPQKHQT